MLLLQWQTSIFQLIYNLIDAPEFFVHLLVMTFALNHVPGSNKLAHFFKKVPKLFSRLTLHLWSVLFKEKSVCTHFLKIP